MYAAVLTFMVVFWVLKELRPTSRISDALVVLGPICVGLMVASTYYLRSRHSALTLARYSGLNVRTKAALGAVSIALYVGIFLRVAELGARNSEVTALH